MIPLFADPVLDVARETALIATQRMLTWADRLTAATIDAKDGGNDLVTAADAEIENGATAEACAREVEEAYHEAVCD